MPYYNPWLVHLLKRSLRKCLFGAISVDFNLIIEHCLMTKIANELLFYAVVMTKTAGSDARMHYPTINCIIISYIINTPAGIKLIYSFRLRCGYETTDLIVFEYSEHIGNLIFLRNPSLIEFISRSNIPPTLNRYFNTPISESPQRRKWSFCKCKPARKAQI